MAPSMTSLFTVLVALLPVSSASSSHSHLHVKHNLLHKRGVNVPAGLPTPWTYKGCYSDSVGSRALGGANYQSGNAMTASACISFCDSKGYVFAGTEYSGECYCGNALAGGSAVQPDSDCNMGCSGKQTDACGGPNRITVFASGKTPPAGPITNPGPAPWVSQGCYSEGTNGRALTTFMPTAGGAGALTVALCTSACQNAQFTLAGVEYSGECYCGNAFSNGGAPAASGCSMVCNGKPSEYCGGPNRLNVYKLNGIPPTTTSTTSTSTTSTTSTTAGTTASPVNGWTSQGCYTDSVGGRALANFFLPNPATVESCLATCKANGFTFGGVEYGGECYCDTAVRNNNGPAPDGNAGCNMPCSGNAQETCGGSNRLNLYQYGASGTTTTNTATTTSSTTATTTTTAATNLPAGWGYAGCYVEGANGRILRNQQPDSNTLTIESCVQTCIGLGYSLAGAEYSGQCFCDNSVVNGGTLAAADTECAMTCSGNAKETCGGPNRVSLYSNGPVGTTQAPGAQKIGLPGAWKYQGCITDGAVKRTFPYQLILDQNNTATNCLSQCQAYGYGAGGMEFGRECYCGDVGDVATAGATIKPEGDCVNPCSGDPKYICGGGNRISYYTWTGATPLTQFNYASGNAAGQYQFLVGGVVVPLITTAGINGKVTFVQKFGTGPPNSTGAYELDIKTLTWREMHVKSDVFCSAGLVLPDKGARQLNVGGWSDASTFGVRLYAPNGSPGVPATNDWEENVGQVSLQVGRWYPSAMVMANGSILVVGGEAGSNGAPVPSLEVLPKPAGGAVQFCDYLQRTDPFNLYPFLAVMPSGKILIAYYNEARLLDEGTLNTVTTLPNIPGAVNNFLGGRTYPFEGTSMLLPQFAPYTAPLQVIICGGSIPGPEVALDNCASIAPEAANPKWTIERMPSKRVISCMTALPDGTYLIINGGKQGRAGFGLASDPNLNAVLYDPTKPVNNRMTLMANTTVARLYHSEAILLDDGRVLVSGSDPEDNTFPEEYRVEVFIPPYLMGNPARPSYTITNMDWTYGQQATFTVTAGSTANLRVSLIGATSSTHGNSMGQRTFFPAVTCAGNTCTVTAPPNNHVCPPGWFQMFILDGPTPSTATWVRIGGDPAALGNWPPGPGWTRPGL